MYSDRINPDKCIACTICQVYCPVAQVTPNFLGPRLVGPAYERFRLLGVGEEDSLHYCANCKNCDIACPHGVPITAFNMIARGVQAKEKGFVARDWILGHGGLLANLFQYLPSGLKNFGMLNPLTRIFLDYLGISKKADIPPFDKYFRRHFKTIKQENYEKTVVFFPGCYIDAYDYKTGGDMVWILNQCGYKVIVPDDFVCCGLPMVSNGFFEDARKNAKINVKAIKKYSDMNIPIITGCPSCALMFKKDIPEYFPKLVPSNYGGGVRDAQEFLLECLENGNLKIKSKKDVNVLYHSPCHLRAQGIGFPGMELMNAVGMKCENAQSGCCGISGSYGFKKGKYEIGMEIGGELFKRVKESKSEVIATECGTCRVQILHGTGRPAIHPVTAVRQAVED